ncbi:1-aminocyclopropane-1-carboxylate oxidase like 7 [Dendrobium catenatum]|uniref:1-aminocyclopropane-1-carboxylate oxidase like 7 n=1 Tax=Dendrobium catenatum TaxID=906689 RepID=A0A2I0VRJ6_9ASPA|nr:1-aminocyclopropane-1-carboxylate oxidase like 7 [Dendrobium catenatum]
MAKEEIVVPVIDLANFPAELEKLAAASTEVGCFQVINHGIPVALLSDMKETARTLFDFPEEVKQRNVNLNVIDGRYRPRNFEPNGKYHESFSIYDAALPSDVLSFCSALDVTPQQREINEANSKVITDYFGKLHGLILEMASKVVESLGLVGRSFEEWSCQARVMSYKVTSQEDIGCIAAPLHTDSSFLTVLQADECVGGLQIIDANGNFVDVDPLPGAIFVNIGDMGKVIHQFLHISNLSISLNYVCINLYMVKVWSNGRLHTVKHRVVCKKVTTRFSIGLFLLAPRDGYIGTEPAFIDAEHPKLYQNFIYNEYRKQRNKCEYKIGDLALRGFKADQEAI